MATAPVITLVNPAHGEKSFHALAKSNNLFLFLDEMTPLSEWLKSRADMPDRLDEAFNPEITEDWAENVEYLCKKEPLFCLIDDVYWSVFFEDGLFQGYHPNAQIITLDNRKVVFAFTDTVNEHVVESHSKASLKENEQSKKELLGEISKGVLKMVDYKQEIDLLKALIKAKS